MPRLSWNGIQNRAVDRLYRKTPFDADKDRLELLFPRYQELTT